MRYNNASKIDLWWSSLQVSEKERIAKKISGEDIPYPDCTEVWKNLPEEKRKSIMEHVSDRHGHLLKDWFEAFPFTD